MDFTTQDIILSILSLFVTGITGKGAWSYYRSRGKSKDHHADLEHESKETYYSSLEKRFNKQFDQVYHELGEVRKENKDLTKKVFKISNEYIKLKFKYNELKKKYIVLKKPKGKKRVKKDETKKSGTDST